MTATDDQSMEQHETFGTLLRQTRQARGLSLETCAHAIRLPVRVLARLEADELRETDYAVYLSGYITKYGRYLGLDPAVIDAELARIKPATADPTLVATGGVSHSRYLLERYATAATYVVLTAVIVAPMIWLGVRGTLDRDLSHLAPLDARPVAVQDAGIAHKVVPAPAAPKAAATRPAADQQPLLASMAPFPSLDGALAAGKPASTADAPAAGPAATGSHALALDLASDSWVEVTRADGTRMQYGLLSAGSHHNYASAGPLDVRIGNADGAKVTLDGRPLPLQPFRHANVAHFRVDDGKATASDN